MRHLLRGLRQLPDGLRQLTADGGTPPRATPGEVRYAVALAVALAAYNNLVNLPDLPRWGLVAINPAATAALLLSARGRLTRAELGLTRAGVRPGLRWGGGILILVAGGLGVALAVPALRGLLVDERVTGLDGAQVAFDVLVRIPLATVLLEEVAFRGALLGAFARWLPTTRAVAWSSAVFGLWHVVPTLEALRVNDVDWPAAAVGAAVAGGVAVTALGGALFCALRLHTRGLLAPLLAHLTTNTAGTLAAYAAARLG